MNTLPSDTDVCGSSPGGRQRAAAPAGSSRVRTLQVGGICSSTDTPPGELTSTLIKNPSISGRTGSAPQQHPHLRPFCLSFCHKVKARNVMDCRCGNYMAAMATAPSLTSKWVGGVPNVGMSVSEFVTGRLHPRCGVLMEVLAPRPTPGLCQRP